MYALLVRPGTLHSYINIGVLVRVTLYIIVVHSIRGFVFIASDVYHVHEIYSGKVCPYATTLCDRHHICDNISTTVPEYILFT